MFMLQEEVKNYFYDNRHGNINQIVFLFLLEFIIIIAIKNNILFDKFYHLMLLCININ
jgi:hypothetical protein